MQTKVKLDPAAEKRRLAAIKGWKTRREKMQLKKKTVIKAPKQTNSSLNTNYATKLSDVALDESNEFINTWYNDAAMAQIYSKGLEFAFVSAAGKQCHPFAYCKDFLHDAVWAEVNETRVGIYGFSYSHGTNPPVDLNQVRLAVRNVGKKGVRTAAKRACWFLNQLEKEMGFEPTTICYGGKYASGKSSVIVFNGDKRWQYAAPLVSLYSLALRVGMTYDGGSWKAHFETGEKIGKNDNSFYNSSKESILNLIAPEPLEFFCANIKDNYPPEARNSVNSLHDGGIVNYTKGYLPKVVTNKWPSKQEVIAKKKQKLKG